MVSDMWFQTCARALRVRKKFEYIYRNVSGSFLSLRFVFSHSVVSSIRGLRTLAPVGQLLTHAQHHMQASSSVETKSVLKAAMGEGLETTFFSVTAAVGHTSAHFTFATEFLIGTWTHQLPGKIL
jgi:hypothetical protein